MEVSVLRALSEHPGLLTRGVPRKLKRNEILFLAGEHPDRLYVLVRGLIKLCARDANGRESIIGLAMPGELVGEIAAIDGSEQPLDAIAATECELMAFDAAALVETLLTSSRGAALLARQLARRCRHAYSIAFERTSAEVEARMAARILDLADAIGSTREKAIEIELPLAQEELGRLAGMCRESACKTLRALRTKGLVDYKGRKLRILRRDALERIRCAGRAEEPFRSTGAGGRARSRSIEVL